MEQKEKEQQAIQELREIAAAIGEHLAPLREALVTLRFRGTLLGETCYNALQRVQAHLERLANEAQKRGDKKQ